MGPKTPCLGTFGLEFEKAIVISELSTLEFSKKSFDIQSAFSKGPGSNFSKGPCPGPGPLYNVCPIMKGKTKKMCYLMCLMCILAPPAVNIVHLFFLSEQQNEQILHQSKFKGNPNLNG